MTTLQTTTGLRSDGVYVLIDDVARGKACDCVCPACQTPLIARQGEKVRWHFAHESSAKITRHCSESDLHLAIKLKIAANKELEVKNIYVAWDYSIRLRDVIVDYFSWDVFNHHVLAFDEIKIESKKDGFIPDLIGVSNGVEYLIEVVVTHDIDNKKMEWIKSNDLNCIAVYPGRSETKWVWTAFHYIREMQQSREYLTSGYYQKRIKELSEKVKHLVDDLSSTSQSVKRLELENNELKYERSLRLRLYDKESIIKEIQQVASTVGWTDFDIRSQVATYLQTPDIRGSLMDHTREELSGFLSNLRAKKDTPLFLLMS